MPKAKTKGMLSDAEFVDAFRKFGPYELSRRLSQSARAVFSRRSRLEAKLKAPIHSKGRDDLLVFRPASHPHRICLDIPNGHVLVASDAHYWPGEPSTMHKALVWACKEFTPKALVMNGDVIDAATISRHPPIGWENRPTVQEEIETAQERLHEIELAVKRSTPLIWTLGNHDSRFETRLAVAAPEFARVNGVHLKDHFPSWKSAWSCWINDDVVVKHRIRSGDHAPFNNVIRSGKSVVTGHLHSAKVIPYTDYNGVRYGVDSGCLADTNHKAFVDYTEDGPLNWRSAFCILTFRNGELLCPELVLKFNENSFQFRGEVLKISGATAAATAATPNHSNR